MSEPNTTPQGFAGYAGVEWVEAGEEEARARLRVVDHHLQPYGFVHGGVYATLAESICSYATAEASGKAALGMSNNTTFLRPVTSGTIEAVARRRHGGRTTWVWDVEMTDDDGRLCALCRMTVAVRDL
jgi:uncharacterized protein (TIGR00369 family)